MEAAFFAIDIIGVVLLLYWSIMNDRRGPDAPSIGLFAYRKTIKQTIKRPNPPAAEDRHSSSKERREARTFRKKPSRTRE